MKKQKGSITVFSLLSLLLVCSTLFVLLEATRLQDLKRIGKMQTRTTVESGFANYNTFLWEEYHLLGTKKSQMIKTMEEIAKLRNPGGINLHRMNVQRIELKEYTLLTDGEGAVFVKNVADYMEENWLYETAKEVYSQYEAIKQLIDSSPLDMSSIEKALQEIETPSAARVRDDPAKEILSSAKDWINTGVLELLVEDTEVLSKAKLDLEHNMINRSLEKGTGKGAGEITWKERILLRQYLLTYFSHLQNTKESRALSYELEYLLGHRSSDMENLRVVAEKLLLIREAANFLYLLSNPEMVSKAEGMALLLAGASANPIVVEVVKMGLLTAWALGESILDVRALLIGKKIPLLKSEDSWTLELQKISTIKKSYVTAKEAEWGINYEAYLGILLLLEDETQLARYALSAQEACIQKQSQDVGFRIDTLLTRARVTQTYSYETIFPFLRVLLSSRKFHSNITVTDEYGYY